MDKSFCSESQIGISTSVSKNCLIALIVLTCLNSRHLLINAGLRFQNLFLSIRIPTRMLESQLLLEGATVCFENCVSFLLSKLFLAAKSFVVSMDPMFVSAALFTTKKDT